MVWPNVWPNRPMILTYICYKLTNDLARPSFTRRVGNVETGGEKLREFLIFDVYKTNQFSCPKILKCFQISFDHFCGILQLFNYIFL